MVERSKKALSVILAAAISVSSVIPVYADEALSEKWNSAGNVVREDVAGIGLSDETKEYALDVTKRLADEGMVLLKNENQVLPLDGGARIALFGSDSWTTSRSDKNTGFITFKEALLASSQLSVDTTLTGIVSELDASGLSAVKEHSDIAVIVIQRGSSEGNESSNYALSSGEESLIKQVSDVYDQVVIVLNTVCQIQSDWMLEDAYGADAVLWAGQPGNKGGQSAADILTGEVNPSGRLVDSWAAGDWEAYPSSAHWGVDETVEGVPTVSYTDDIYVGYRYFETFDIPVNYEFGYGLSYTEFEWSDYSMVPNWTDGTVTASVKVTNTGNTAGKDVVELYFSYPDAQGLITMDVPSIQLLQYGKTRLLKPGESETVSIQFQMSDLALYNEASTCWQMYAGDYKIKFGRSVKEIKEVKALSYTSTTSVLGGTLGHKMTPQKEIEVLADTPNDGNLTVNGKVVKRYYDEAADSTNRGILGTGKTLTTAEINGGQIGYTLSQVSDGSITMDEFVEDLSLLELTKMLSGVSNGAPFANPYYDADGDGQYTFRELQAEINRNVNLSYTGLSNGILERDVYNITMQDRQESVNVNAAYTQDEEGNVINKSNHDFGFQVYPSCVVIASSWNQELAEEYGTAIGQEMLEAGMDTWFSPSMNIHRNPAGGRNSEYFSEDPILSGYSAAAASKGVERLGLNVTLKHFAGNNQEEQRRQINEIISERALREIYLKGYEIAVKATSDKEQYPGVTGVMSAYNKINGAWASENYDMLHKIAEEEWGFSGWVVTDYQMECDLYLALAAGTCIWAPTIPGAVGNVTDEDRAMFTRLYHDLEKGYIPLSQIRKNVKHTMETALVLLERINGTQDTAEPEAVKLSANNLTLETNETCQLDAEVIPAQASAKTLTWTSSNPETASVDQNGLVTAKHAGTAVITAAAKNGIAGSCKVTVRDLKAELEEAKKKASEAEIAAEAAKNAVEEIKKDHTAARAEIEKLRQEAREAARIALETQTALKRAKFAAGTVKLTKVQNTPKSRVRIAWKKRKDADGYVIQYADNAKFKKAKTKSVKNAASGNTVLKKLKKGKKYYIRIRAYKKIEGQKVPTKYSKAKTVQISSY